jgi:hypothetical protein
MTNNPQRVFWIDQTSGIRKKGGVAGPCHPGNLFALGIRTAKRRDGKITVGEEEGEGGRGGPGDLGGGKTWTGI